jgi:PTH2 family peptidyl-tRNA hydrolase
VAGIDDRGEPTLPEPSPDQVKQVIVIRRDLRMRRGKEIAQGAHASSAWLVEAVAGSVDAPTGQAAIRLDPVARVWATSSWRKVTLQVETEDELLELHAAAQARGLRSHLVRDSGRTEFGGVPTVTALAIGPDLSAAIDEVTGGLALY